MPTSQRLRRTSYGLLLVALGLAAAALWLGFSNVSYKGGICGSAYDWSRPGATFSGGEHIGGDGRDEAGCRNAGDRAWKRVEVMATSALAAVSLSGLGVFLSRPGRHPN